MPEIKAIETRFDGHRFRSRTEARWAVFFRELGLNYEYEPEGYVLPGGECYLPDFWLPGLEFWFECKRSNFLGTHLGDPPATTLDWKDYDKCRELCIAKKQNVLIAFGAPALKPEDRQQLVLLLWDETVNDAIEYGDNTGQNQLRLRFNSTKSCELCLTYPGFWYPSWCWDLVEVYCEDIERAYEKAAYARFEHGETPST